MYSIFHPLDVNERLPRELLLEGRRNRWLDMRHLQVIGFLYLPAVVGKAREAIDDIAAALRATFTG